MFDTKEVDPFFSEEEELIEYLIEYAENFSNEVI